ncbi:MAG: penicillin-binding protein 2 [Magnetococcales bacterium]|nr:penicillin-binding protein 2 [Magnetococcales bacterium]MBF0114939.1 penicillin-binding protein 2 [Magnetococcales bacterium]
MFDEKPKTFQVDARRRLLVLGGGITLLFSALTSRLFYLQLLKSGTFRDMADDNRISLQLLSASRGRIFDRNGVLLVENLPDYQLVAIPELASQHLRRSPRDRSGLARLLESLKPLLQLDDKEIQTVLKQASRQRAFLPLTVKTHLTWEEVSLIETRIHELPGVTIEVQPQRYYRTATLASHAIGYLGEVTAKDQARFQDIDFRPGDLLGKSGVERAMESKLRGMDGLREIEVNAYGRQVRELRRTPPRPGQDIALTLDMDLQQEAERALAESSGGTGAMVIMRPHSGELLVMASQPSYNPNQFVNGFLPDEWRQLTQDPNRPLTNKAIQGQYPPGSTFKMVVVFAALRLGKLSEHDTFYCPGYTTRQGHRFYCWRLHGHGTVNLTQAISQSCDVFFYELAERIGIDAIHQQALRMGLGTLTGIALEGERAGLIPSRAWKRSTHKAGWYPGETLITAIGQGYTLSTPMQLAVMISAIANGGAVYRPFLVKPEQAPLAVTPGQKPGPAGITPLWHNHFRPEHVALIHTGLEEVVHGVLGTARTAKLNGVRMAGKTGTSQVARHRRTQSGSVLKTTNRRLMDHAMFVAYAPAQQPEIAVAVIVEHGGGGGTNAAPVAKRVMDLYFAKQRGETVPVPHLPGNNPIIPNPDDELAEEPPDEVDSNP